MAEWAEVAAVEILLVEALTAIWVVVVVALNTLDNSLKIYIQGNKTRSRSLVVEGRMMHSIQHLEIKKKVTMYPLEALLLKLWIWDTITVVTVKRGKLLADTVAVSKISTKIKPLAPRAVWACREVNLITEKLSILMFSHRR